MKTSRYQVIHCVRLKDDLFSMAGIVEGEVPDIGSAGVALSPDSGLTVEVEGIGVVDPNLLEPGRRGLLVKVVAGEGEDLNGSIIEFTWEEKS